MFSFLGTVVILFAVHVFFVQPAFAVATTEPEFEREVQRILSDKKVSAAAVGVVRRSGVLLSKGYGEVSSGQPTTVDSYFRIASVSKVFTSLGILKLVDAGRLELDRPVRDYLPWFTLSGGRGLDRLITIRHLLTHTSGISRELGCPFSTEVGEWMPLFDLPACVVHREVLFTPGRRLKYSNLGMTLLGRVIAEVSGAPGSTMEEKFENFMVSEVFNPLGMRDTHYTLDSIQIQRLATPLGHLLPAGKEREKFTPVHSTFISAPAWGVATTIRDLAQLLPFIFDIIDGRPNALISQSLAAQILKNPIQDVLGDLNSYQGLGFSIKKSGTTILVGHGGHFPGYTTQLFFDNVRQTGFAVLTNSIDRTAAAEILTAAQIHFGASGEESRDLLASATRLTSDGSEAAPDIDEAYRKATCLGTLAEYQGTYKGWPMWIVVSESHNKLILDYAGAKWILTPECSAAGLRFRLDKTGRPNYVVGFGETLSFARAVDGRIDRLMFGEVYPYLKQ